MSHKHWVNPMKNYSNCLLKKTLVAVLVASTLVPAHSAPLGLNQFPPSTTIPPIPNVVVTLDDSGSMAAQIDYVPATTYVIPPRADGSPFPMLTAPNAYDDGYLASGTRDLSTDPDYVAATDKQNYVNWWSFYRTRNHAMRGAVLRAFAPQIVPDDRMRIAWQGLTTCAAFNGSCIPNGLSASVENRMRSLSTAHRANFASWVSRVATGSGTPLRAAYQRVGTYMQTNSTDVQNPFRNSPGTTFQTGETYLSCRKSYHVLFTDGQWNDNVSPGNDDNTAKTLPDGTSYTVTPPYRGPANGGGNTLSDLAFRYWSTDLQPNIANGLKPVIKEQGTATYGTSTVSEYWNPRNNPAKWQNLSLFAVGFGPAADLDPTSSGLASAPTFETNTTTGDSFAEIVAGTREWPSTANFNFRQFDLWHAAVNARGEMFPAQNLDDLVNAFNKIVTEILAQNANSGGAASSAAFTSDFVAIEAGLDPEPVWRGIVKGYSQTNGQIDISTPIFSVSEQLGTQDPGSRVVLTASSPTQGIPFAWNNLSAFQRDRLNRDYSGFVDNFGVQRVAYLRGSNANEATAAGPNPVPTLRSRQGYVLGTIVNSEPRFIGQPRDGYRDRNYPVFRTAQAARAKTVYIGANDGMLHAMSAVDGSVRLSYVPRGVFSRLSEYTHPTFTHKYYVDGPIFSGDIDLGTPTTPSWKTVLIGGLGAGGKGLFALDVTNPSNFSEANASSLVLFDYTGSADTLDATSKALLNSETGSSTIVPELDSDLGQIMGDPARDPFIGRNLQIAQMENGRWALITGNGINSANERAVLYVLYLDAAGGFIKIPVETATGTGNGLSTPLPVDVDGNGRVDTVYAGDLKGRLWKFDLSNASSNAWGVSNKVAGTGQPLLNVGKPITTAPGVTTHPRGGIFVTFGTGQLYTVPDKTNTATQTLYGVWEKPGASPGTIALADLDVRTLSSSSAGFSVTGGGVATTVRTLSTSTIDYNTKRGWLMNLTDSGERLIFNPIVRSRVGFFSTYVPKEGEACDSGSVSGSLLGFDLINGKPPASSWAFDYNNDGAFNNNDYLAGANGVAGSDGNTIGGISVSLGKLVGIINRADSGAANDRALGAKGNRAVPPALGPGRQAWRDLTP